MSERFGYHNTVEAILVHFCTMTMMQVRHCHDDGCSRRNRECRLTALGGEHRYCRTRRRGRVAEGGGLLNRYTLQRRIEGSNPSVSASAFAGTSESSPGRSGRVIPLPARLTPAGGRVRRDKGAGGRWPLFCENARQNGCDLGTRSWNRDENGSDSLFAVAGDASMKVVGRNSIQRQVATRP